MDTNITTDKQSQERATELVGLVPGLVGSGVDLAGIGMRTTLGLIAEMRGQTLTFATQSIDFAEGLTRGFFEFSRRSAKRIDQAVSDALVAFERVTNSALSALRTTSEQAARLAMTVAEGAVGPRRSPGGNTN